MAKIKYFDVHVFYDRNNGGSFYIKGEFDGKWDEDDVINYALDNDLIDAEDALCVDYVAEIDKKEYERATNKS